MNYENSFNTFFAFNFLDIDNQYNKIMDATKFISVLNKIDKPKKSIMDKIGLSYTGFDRSVKNGSMKVSTLELFCMATDTHISEFFPDWIVIDENRRMPKVVSELQVKYQSNYNKSINDVIQAKDDLITEQRERIKELSELVSMFKTGKIKLAE